MLESQPYFRPTLVPADRKGLGVISDPSFFDFFEPRMEFEEFIELFAVWYSRGRDTAACIGIRADESLNRYRTIAVWDKDTHFGKRCVKSSMKSSMEP
mgnify:CR=1 FL=1